MSKFSVKDKKWSEELDKAMNKLKDSKSKNNNS